MVRNFSQSDHSYHELVYIKRRVRVGLFSFQLLPKIDESRSLLFVYVLHAALAFYALRAAGDLRKEVGQSERRMLLVLVQPGILQGHRCGRPFFHVQLQEVLDKVYRSFRNVVPGGRGERNLAGFHQVVGQGLGAPVKGRVATEYHVRYDPYRPDIGLLIVMSV